MAAISELRLLARSYCHLCDDMLAALLKLRGEYLFEVDVVDVDADAMLIARYDELVPVLLDARGEELCHYFLDEPKVREYLSQFG